MDGRTAAERAIVSELVDTSWLSLEELASRVGAPPESTGRIARRLVAGGTLLRGFDGRKYLYRFQGAAE